MLNTSVLQIGPKRNPTFVASDYAIGKELYEAGELIDACANAEQLRGFRAEMYAEADADTSAYIVRLGRGVEDVELDYADIRRGWM